MTPLFKKLQFKKQDPILVVDAPPEFQPHLRAMSAFTRIETDPAAVDQVDFLLLFARRSENIAARLPLVRKKLSEDALLWWAYPKKSSKNYDSDISRDHGWGSLGELGFEGVRQIAIDDDWSALRFRHADHIKKMTRVASRAMSKEGKKKLK